MKPGINVTKIEIDRSDPNLIEEVKLDEFSYVYVLLLKDNKY